MARYLLWKAYFDKGLGVTSYAKYIIALFGFYSYANKIDLNWTILIGFLYATSCVFIGKLWYKFKLIDIENEIQNLFNPFQREMRKRLGRDKL